MQRKSELIRSCCARTRFKRGFCSKCSPVAHHGHCCSGRCVEHGYGLCPAPPDQLFHQPFLLPVAVVRRSPAGNILGLWVIVIPVIGGLVIGLIARYGSEAIRGHGIPEAIEAILFGKSKMSPKVAVLKPLSSAIAIGSGGPFGAEGPIIMTGGALGSLIAQCVKVTASERKTLLVAGAAAGMTAVFGTPVAAVLLDVELLLFEWRPRSFLPVAVACAIAGFTRAIFFGTGPLFPLET